MENAFTKPRERKASALVLLKFLTVLLVESTVFQHVLKNDTVSMAAIYLGFLKCVMVWLRIFHFSLEKSVHKDT